MKVGIGRAEIRFPMNFFPSEGFTEVLSPLYVRALVLKENAGFALLSLELTSLPDHEVDHLRVLLSSATGIAKESCWITVTHTFSAPHFLPNNLLNEDMQIRNDIFHKVMETAAKEAIVQAMDNMAEARLSFGQTECRININRDMECSEGWWVGNNGEGPSDKTLSVLSAFDRNGEPVAILMHYPVQSSIMDGSVSRDGGKAVTSDLAGRASSILEAKYPKAAAIFLMGAAGDQAPIKKARTIIRTQENQLQERDDYESGIGFIEELGSQMAECVEEAIDKAKPLPKVQIKHCSREFSVPAKYMNPNLRELKPTRRYEYISQGNRDTKVEAVAIGDIVLMGVKPELNCITAMQICSISPFSNTLVMCMVNGGAKYMADQESYDRCTYEAMNSPFDKGAAEILCQEVKAMLEQLQENEYGSLP